MDKILLGRCLSRCTHGYLSLNPQITYVSANPALAVGGWVEMGGVRSMAGAY